MPTREDVWKQFVASYDVEVSEQSIQNELEYLKTALRHAMTYDTLTGGASHPFPQQELDAQASELRATAEFEAKAPLVLKAIIAEQNLDTTQAELEAEAWAIAQRQGSTVEALKQFFGEDLAMLRRDVLERKAVDWACESLGYKPEDLEFARATGAEQSDGATHERSDRATALEFQQSEEAQDEQQAQEDFVRSNIAPLLNLFYKGDEARIEAAIAAILSFAE